MVIYCGVFQRPAIAQVSRMNEQVDEVAPGSLWKQEQLGHSADSHQHVAFAAGAPPAKCGAAAAAGQPGRAGRAAPPTPLPEDLAALPNTNAALPQALLNRAR